jgi:isopentenyldiphosphate isomerase
MADQETEMLDVSDADDRVVGTLERGEIHRRGLFHRSVHVFLFDASGRIYLQRRSLGKAEHPGKWDCSASGHVESGESYGNAARRELEEEIGVRGRPEPVLKVLGSERTGMEHSVLFEVRSKETDPDPTPNPAEILEGRFFGCEEVEAAVSADPEAFSPSFRLLFRLYREGAKGNLSFVPLGETMQRSQTEANAGSNSTLFPSSQTPPGGVRS